MEIRQLVTNPVGRSILLIVAMILMIPMVGAVNEWTMHTIAKGVVNNERFDRVAYCGADAAACEAADTDGLWAGSDLDDAGTALAATKYMKIAAAGTGCQLASSGTIVSNPTAGITPTGTVIPLSDTGSVNGCTWEKAAALFTRGPTKTIITLLFSVAGLAFPIGAMISLGQFGGSFFMQHGGSGMQLIISGVLILVGLLLLVILGSTVIPFIGNALNALDSDRYYIYGTQLGGIAPVLGDFWGVIFVGGVIAVVWQAVNFFRSSGSGNATSGIFSGGGSGGGSGGRM